MDKDSFYVSYIAADGRLRIKIPISEIDLEQMEGCQPIRGTPAYRGQAHLPGLYYMAQLERLVPYESRLEMTTLTHVDYSIRVRNVVSQPLTIHYTVGKKPRHHVPDFLLVHADGTFELVDVKPSTFAASEKNKSLFEMTRRFCQVLGWRYSVRGEVSATYHQNVMWLAGFRRPPPKMGALAQCALEACAAGPISFADLVGRTGPDYFARPVVFHLLWQRALTTNMETLLEDSSLVNLPASGGSDVG